MKRIGLADNTLDGGFRSSGKHFQNIYSSEQFEREFSLKFRNKGHNRRVINFYQIFPNASKFQIWNQGCARFANLCANSCVL